MVKDLDLFRAAMADVTPLKGRRARPAVGPTSPRAPEERRAGAVATSVRRATAAAEGFSFDRDIDRALSRGRRAPEAKLDLHGMTLAAAERAVARFLEEAVALDLRVVLVVTGKGLRSDGDRIVSGRIRAEFPNWLERPANRVHVRGFKPAHPRHGGGGAFYVLLRRSSRGRIPAR
jgi:DNA-nicking Smr family endonuclease